MPRKKFLRSAMAATAALAIVGLISACTGSNTPDTTSGDSENPWVGDKSEVYQLIDFAPSYAFFVDVYAGFQAAADQLGVSVEHGGGQQLDVGVQVTAFEQMAAKNPAGIAVSPFDAQAFTGPINTAIDAGVPVITFDSDAPDSNRSTYIGTDSYAGGVAAADALAQFYPDGANIGIVTLVGSTNFETRFRGMQDKIASDYPSLKVIATANGGADANSSAAATQSMLQANPDIDVIVAGTTSFLVGALQAVKEANLSIKVNTFDGVEPTIDSIRSGVTDFAISQAPWSMGYWSLINLYALKHDLVNPFPNGGEFDISPLPGFTNTGIQTITKDNLDAFE